VSDRCVCLASSKVEGGRGEAEIAYILSLIRDPRRLRRISLSESLFFVFSFQTLKICQISSFIGLRIR
jgi:hypothetical protein